MKRLLFILGILATAITPGGAQSIPDALFTAATTATDTHGRPWAYVAFSPVNDGVLRGRSLAVYVKNGLPEDPGGFTRQGVVSPELEASLLAVFLERGQHLGEDLAELDTVLYDIYRTRGAEKNALVTPLPTPPKPALPEMLSSLLNRATGDAETAASMRMLGLRHPSVRMAVGEAWAGPLTAAPGQPVTIEARDWSTAGDGAVVARVTLTAGQPVVLPAPGPPVQVPDLTPNGDLNIKLRWGQEENLRRQSALISGFQVWRVRKDFATANGVASAAPSLAQLKNWANTGDAVLSSDRPISAGKAFSPAEAANLVTDPTTHFVTDDGRRFRTNGMGQNIDVPFTEGEEYTFFVTTRDILGRDGPPSLPGHGIVCRTLPPPVPGDLRLENHWEPDNEPNTTSGTQAIQFFWRANANTARDVTTYYELYRGTDLTPLNSPDLRAGLVSFMANQPHQTDGSLMSIIDTSPDVLNKGFGETLWYSVRAVHMSPLGPIKSDFSAPVMIAKRQREGPAAPSGFVEANCARASVIYASQQTVTPPELPVNDGLVRLRLLCQRLDPGIAHADLSVRVGATVTDLGRHVYAAEGNWVAADFEIVASALPGDSLTVICQSTTHTGMLSNVKEYVVQHLGPGGRREVTMQTKTLSNADLIPGEVFSDELLEPYVSASAIAFSGGYGLALSPPAMDGRVFVIQTSPVGGFAGVWTNRGHGLARSSQLIFSMPPLPEGQNQVALDVRLFAVREFGGSCADLAYTPGSGQAGKLGVVVFTTPRSEEYRLFRRINDGPYTLVGQGGAAYAAGNPVNAVRREDDALPMTDCTICYYAQTVDRDGNASAMVRLDPCIERKAPTLPKPRLSPPLATGTSSAAKMKLTWSCPPEGVERFLITIKSKGGPAAQSSLQGVGAISLTATISPALANRMVTYLDADSEGKLTPSVSAAGPASQAGNGDNLSMVRLSGAKLVFQKMVQTSAFITPPLGNGYASEPPFTAEFDVQPGVTYSVFVQAVRGALLNGQGRGPASAKYEFKWEEPGVGPEPEVAWPARPLQEVTLVPGVIAGEVDPVLWPGSLAGQRPVGVKLASLPTQGSEDHALVSNEVVYAPRETSPGFGRHDPNAHLPRPIGDALRQVQGVVLYRRQVANQLFPAVPGDVIQVSPLVRQIAWIPTTHGTGLAASRLVDPFFAIKFTSSGGGQDSLDLYLLDTQGVINGARYQYFVVCFGPDGEITQTIDAGYYGPN